jgi:hypothetical protein
VDQHADALIARSREPSPLRFRGDPSIGLRDRDLLVVESNELLDEPP